MNRASMNYPEGMLCVSTTWDKTTQTVISDFCERTLKQTPSKVYCTVVGIDLSKQQKEDAARHEVMLIPATRPKWSYPAEDPPAINWLLHHDKYYDTGIAPLKGITHVVGLFAKTHSAASAIRENLFPRATLHQIPSTPSALFVSNYWHKDELGLTGFHRTLVKDFCERKANAGEDLKAYIHVYSTVIDVKISGKQKTDAESCGVTLIEAQRRGGIEPQHDPPRPEWLLLHECYYPNLGKIENVHYVVGYAPKTGFAAAYIRENLFPSAKLVLINHACPERNCLQAKEYGEVEFEAKMLDMASKADLLFSIGPRIYKYFRNAYKAEVNGKELSEIPHEEILPIPIKCPLGEVPREGETEQHHILTCGQMDTKQAIDRCHLMAASIGNAANRWKAANATPPTWKIQGVSKQVGKIEEKFLTATMKCPHVQPIFHPGHSAKSLLTSLRQSHLCLPSSYYTDYSFYGMEAMVSGLPTAVDEYSHLGHFINKYLKEHAFNCILPAEAKKKDLSDAILKYLKETTVAFKQAKDLAEDLVNSEDMAKRYAIFTTLLTPTVMQQTGEVGRDMADTLSVQIELDASDGHHQQHKETEEDVKALLAKGSKEPEQEMVNKLKIKLTRRVEEVVADEECREEVIKILEKILEDVVPELLKVGSLGILLRFLTLYNLYKLKQTCRSGSLAKAFEPLLITDEMREIAAEAGIKLQLKATYDAEKFEEVEVFFINRDGGGIQQVKFYENVIEDENDENLTFDRHDTVVTEYGKLQPKSNVTETGQRDSHQKDQGKRKDPSKLLLLELDDECEIKSSTETNVCSLFKAEKCIRWTGRQFDVLQAVITMTDRVERILSSRQEILALLGVTRYLLADSEGLPFLELEEQLIQHGEPTQPITVVYETQSLQARSLLLHKSSKKTLTDSEIRYLELAQSEVHSLQSKLDKAFTEKKILETQLAEAVQEKSQQERQCQEYRQRYHGAEKVVSTQLNDRHKFKDRVEKLEIKIKEKDTIITQLKTRLSQLSDAQSDIELQKSIAESLQLGVNVSTEMEQKGHWSKKILYGHESPKRGQKFKGVRGLAFHNDKLLVCDSDSNIVHILNKDYTCEKELGSFSGQFAKPFKPQSIAVSKDNLYFILDNSNVQIVVCDQNNQIIKVINLPANSNPWCIALVKGFVIVTEVNSHRVLKYSLDGEYIYDLGRRGVDHTEFSSPYFVAVNSRDVIMVSDSGNHCIKCFDTQFNYQYKYSQFDYGDDQLFYPDSIAVDGADNVYVCDEFNGRISVWSRDRMWRHHLFKDEVNLPRYMAVTADGDRIAIVSGFLLSWNEIVVFSK